MSNQVKAWTHVRLTSSSTDTQRCFKNSSKLKPISLRDPSIPAVCCEGRAKVAGFQVSAASCHYHSCGATIREDTEESSGIWSYMSWLCELFVVAIAVCVVRLFCYVLNARICTFSTFFFFLKGHKQNNTLLCASADIQTATLRPVCLNVVPFCFHCEVQLSSSTSAHSHSPVNFSCGSSVSAAAADLAAGLSFYVTRVFFSLSSLSAVGKT